MKTRRLLSAIAALTVTVGLSACHSGKQQDADRSETAVHETVDGRESPDKDAGSNIGVSQESTENASGLYDDLYASKIELNGTILTLPCEMSDLEAFGFSLPESVKERVIGGGRYTTAEVRSATGDIILIALYNTGDSDRTAEQCEVYEMTFEKAVTTEDMDISIAKGITYGFTKEQVEAIYGDPISEYTNEEDDIRMMYRAQGCTIDFCFLNNSLCNIHFQRDAA